MINPEEEPVISTDGKVVSPEQVEQREAWVAGRQNDADILNNERGFIERKLNLGETTEKDIALVEATAENTKVDALASEIEAGNAQRAEAAEKYKAEKEQAAKTEAEDRKFEIISRINAIDTESIQLQESRAEVIADGQEQIWTSPGIHQSSGRIESIDGKLATLQTEKDSLKLEHERLSAELEASKIGLAA
jgi:seryl-tRNA synthetase